MTVHATTFVQTRIIEALPTDGATTEEIVTFLDGTGYSVTRKTPNGEGMLYKEGHGYDGHMMFRNSMYLVKVNGNVAAPVKDYMLHTIYG
jgi:hypothetical protein